MKQIFIFYELHISVLNFLADNCIQIDVLDRGEKLNVDEFLYDMDYIYIYNGTMKVKLCQNYGVGALKQIDDPSTKPDITDKFFLRKG